MAIAFSLLPFSEVVVLYLPPYKKPHNFPGFFRLHTVAVHVCPRSNSTYVQLDLLHVFIQLHGTMIYCPLPLTYSNRIPGFRGASVATCFYHPCGRCMMLACALVCSLTYSLARSLSWSWIRTQSLQKLENFPLQYDAVISYEFFTTHWIDDRFHWVRPHYAFGQIILRYAFTYPVSTLPLYACAKSE